LREGLPVALPSSPFNQTGRFNTVDRGYVKLWRKLKDSVVFQNPNILKMFIWGLLKATHKEVWIPVKTGKGEEIVCLKPGQFIFGRYQSAKELNVPPSSARNWLHFLENAQIWDSQKGQHYSIVTICNWDIYQKEQEKDGQPKRTTKGQPKDTNKNDKNVKKYTADAKEILSAYPRKADENNSLKSIQQLLKSGMDKKTLLRTVDNYKASIQRKGTKEDFIIQSNNFFGRAERYKEYLDAAEENKVNPVELAMQRCKERGDI
jgi:hypothetical protein